VFRGERLEKVRDLAAITSPGMQLRAIDQCDLMIALHERLDLANAIRIHDGRAMHPQEILRKALLEAR
jgi:hypothetical protein